MRIAITGASGWLARSAYFAISKLQSEGIDISCTMFSSNPKTIGLRDGGSFTSNSVDDLFDAHFDIYVPLAFLTQEKFRMLGRGNYVSSNLDIINRDKQILQRNKSAKVLLMSSGVVVRPSQLHKSLESYKCYADLKRFQEESFREIVGEQNQSICYLYSCTSLDMPRWQDYAFSSIIHSVIHDNVVTITNPLPVIRRYVDSRELFLAMFRDLQFRESFRISSGGTLIELEQLANLAIAVLGSHAQVVRTKDESQSVSDEYFTEDYSMEQLFERNQQHQSSIEQQIITTSQIFHNS